MQKSATAAELRGLGREEDEERRDEGEEKENDLPVLFMRHSACVRRANPGAADFGSPAVALIIADLTNKNGIFMVTSYRFTVTRGDDNKTV